MDIGGALLISHMKMSLALMFAPHRLKVLACLAYHPLTLAPPAGGDSNAKETSPPMQTVPP